MYAIIQTGGKQLRVEKGDIIEVERIPTDDKDYVAFEEILFVHDGKNTHVGAPHVAGFQVKAKYIQEVKGPKVIAFKMKRRKNYRRKRGHRQKYSQCEITEIVGKGE